SSNSGVLCAPAVEQQGCCADRSIEIHGVKRQRSTAETGIEVTDGIDKERTPTERCISRAGSEKTKRFAPFRCREIGIAPLRRWRCRWRRRRRRGRRQCRGGRGYRRGRRDRASRAVELNSVEIRGPVTNDRIVELK